MEGELALAVGHLIFDLKERAFLAVVGLDGEVDGVVALGPVGVQLDRGGQAAGAGPLC